MIPEPPIVFLADDDPIQLLYLGGILRAAEHRVEAFARPEALLARLSVHDRGCVTVDLQMPGLDGLGLQRALLERDIRMPLIFISGSAGVPEAVAAMKRGAVDFLTKPVEPANLLAVVERALRTDAERAAERMAREEARARWSELSSRERDVCRLLANGLVIKQVASELGTAETTVQVQRARAFKKLGVDTVVALSRLLDRVGDGDRR